MAIDYNGYVGIGTASPVCPLHVWPAPSIATTSGTYVNFLSASVQNLSAGNSPISIRGEGYLAGPGILCYSDQRIKHKIVTITSSLDVISRLRPVEYEYIDTTMSGNSKKIGYIAQEVFDVIPAATSTVTGVVPSIYKLSESVSGNTITLTDHNLTVGDIVRLVSNVTGAFETTVVAVSGSHFTIEKEPSSVDSSYFVYGKKVSDYMSINYDFISTIAVRAIQELSTENTALKSRLDSLESRLAAAGI